jgi:membrane protein
VAILDRVLAQQRRQEAGGGGAIGERVTRHLPHPVRTIVERLRKEDIFLLSAGLAFYALVSVAPFAILVLWAISLGAGDDGVQAIAGQLGRLLPTTFKGEEALTRVAELGGGLGFGALLALLWPASAYGSGLSRAFERLCPGGDMPAKGLRGRALALALVGVMPALVLVGLVASYVASSLWGRGAVQSVLGLVLMLTIGFIISGGAVAAIFKLFSPRPVSGRGLLHGGALAGASISLLSAAYVLFLHVGADFERRYVTSGLAAIVLLAVWLFLANALILVGYQLAIEVE